MKTSSWTYEDVFYDGEDFFVRLCDHIDSAKEFIEIEVYIFSDEERPRILVEKLKRAAERGVQVRVLVDGIGSFGFSETHLQELRAAGVRARVYHPTPWDYNFSEYLWWVRWREYIRFFGKLNRRNHRKVFLFDRRQAIVSSSNLFQAQLVSSDQKESWRDTSVEIQGQEVELLLMAFERAWKYSTGLTEVLDRRGLKPFKKSLLNFNFTRAQRRDSYMDLIYRIYSAKKKVWITNAYFVPDGSLLKALRFAAWTGVEVNVLVPHKSDVFFIRWVSSAFYFGLLLSGVRIFEYLPRVLHAKSIIVDDWAIVGTSNLNHRSLFQDLEVDVVLTQLQSLESLNRQYVSDLLESQQITLEDWQARPKLEKWIGHWLLQFRYWL
jgi:cardiolipin synthase